MDKNVFIFSHTLFTVLYLCFILPFPSLSDRNNSIVRAGDYRVISG